MTSRMRVTRAHTKNRRSHHGVNVPHLSKCNECGALHVMHRVCDNCGVYRGKKIIDVEAQIAKKAERIKNKRKELGQEPEKNDDKEEKKNIALNPEELSKKT